MPQVILNLCDVCHARDEAKVEGDQVRVALMGRQERMVILCESCRSELVDPLAAMLDRHGSVVKVGTPAAKPPAVKAKLPGASLAAENPPCPMDDCDYQGPTRNALGTHLRERHGVSIMDVLPYQRPEMEKPWVDCPEPGCEYGKGPNRDSWSQHIRNVHGKTLTEVGLAAIEGRGRQPIDIGELPCDQDGCDHVSKNAAGHRIHLSRTHGIKSARAVA